MDCILQETDKGRGWCPTCDPHKSFLLPNTGVRRKCKKERKDSLTNQRYKEQGNASPLKGPGTELKTILQRFGIRPTSGCKCTKRCAIMDSRGDDWCEQNIPEIVGWLHEEAKRRRLPFSKTLGALLVKKAIRNSRNRKKKEAAKPKETPTVEEDKSSMNWAYGVTTVPSRLNDLLPQTLASLKLAGFDKPRLFVDGEADQNNYAHFGLELTTRHPLIKTYSNWVLSLWELYAREPDVDRYAIFQDDFVTYRNLRQYLERCKYPETGYWNLYTFPKNQKLAPKDTTGWYVSNQLGKGAVALIFSRATIVALFGQPYMVNRLQTPGKRRHQAVDGAVVSALKLKGWKEYVHNPSLVQHTGKQSTMKHGTFPAAESFRGEDFDALELCPK